MATADVSAPDPPPRIAIYRRRVGAALGRVWENVHDWEHLPWLHYESFRSIECIDQADWGWHARVGLQPASEIELELRVEDGADRYVARTLRGPGAGTEIWTALRDAGDDQTDIEVSFHVPGIEAPEAAGRAFVHLYERLWDQDEAMMRVRTHELLKLRAQRSAPETPRDLGPLAALRARLPVVIDWGRDRFRIVEIDGELLVHAAVCPHWRGPLDAASVKDGCVRCPWHGDRFDVRTGASVEGRGLQLPAPPTLEIDAGGSVHLVPRRR